MILLLMRNVIIVIIITIIIVVVISIIKQLLLLHNHCSIEWDNLNNNSYISYNLDFCNNKASPVRTCNS